jgi:hypothetical protein
MGNDTAADPARGGLIDFALRAPDGYPLPAIDVQGLDRAGLRKRARLHA